VRIVARTLNTVIVCEVSRGSHGKRVRSFDQLFTETEPRITTISLVQYLQTQLNLHNTYTKSKFKKQFPTFQKSNASPLHTPAD
jgi:hypothetical protein